MTELDLIIDFHKSSDRQGPGRREDTLRALKSIKTANEKGLKAADIGCGCGGQTLTLAQHIDGQITAVDLFPAFLNEVQEKAKQAKLQDKITILEKSMDALPFGPASLDIIWSEGAIYNIGFEAGIQNWKKFLKPGAYLAVSEITWTTPSRPKEIEDFWNREYPEINTAAGKIRQLEDNGYSLVAYFVLPPESWINYYQPMEARFLPFLEKHAHSPTAQRVVAEHQEEIKLYHKFKAYYSYGFYIARNS